MTRSLLAPALVLSSLLVAPAQAADPPAPKVDAAARVAALEQRIAALEADAQALREQAAAASQALEATRAEMEAMKLDLANTSASTGAEPAADASTAAGANGNAFNPAISLLLNGSYTSHSRDPDGYLRSGFPLVGEGGPAPRGFSLGESEISFSANIDDRFYGQLTLALGSEDGDTEANIEEAYVDTNALPGGLSLRMGRFFSNIGYLNGHHAHTDRFFDRPLPYQAFLGNQFGDDGVQLRWVAPTDTFLEVGGEIFRGDSFPASGARNGGSGARTLFAHAGGDIGDEQAWLAGLSVLDASGDTEDGFSGDTRLWIADATWKWAPRGNFKDGGITLRGEYFLESRDGMLDDGATSASWKGDRRGAYLEGVYRINRRWETGYRFDRLWSDAGLPLADGHSPQRHSVMLAWLNSEFSLVRLQASRDRPDDGNADTTLTLQYQTSLGAHGAHKF